MGLLDLLYELSFKTCVGCDRCAQACPWHPLFKPSQRVSGVREAIESCTMCGRCVLYCPIKVPVHKRVYNLKIKGFVDQELVEIIVSHLDSDKEREELYQRLMFL